VQEAAELSGLNDAEFAKLTEIAQDVALGLHEIFARSGLELWDGKVELLARSSRSTANLPGTYDERNGYAGEDGAEIILADSIGPDELRLLYNGEQLSKEMIRQFYRGSDWEMSLKEAQKMATARGTIDWKQICAQELGSAPQSLADDFKSVVDKLYGVLANAVVEPAPFSKHPDLDSFSKELLALKAKKS
jgi:phosphoribosylaminoimidazole-succinocarboxamide synthase